MRILLKQKALAILAVCILLGSAGSSRPNGDLQVVAQPINATLVKGESDVLEGPSVFKLDGYFVWGASVVQGKDGKFHMIFSLWESGPEHDTFNINWVLESKLGYAVSDFPDRDFIFQKIILKGALHDGKSEAWDAQMVHNPHLKKFGDKFYLYYIGGRDLGESVAPDLDKRTRVQQSLQIGVIEFDSFSELLEGTFDRPVAPLLSPRSRVKDTQVLLPSPPGSKTLPDNLIVVNPSVDFNPNTGEYMLFFKGNIYEPTWKGVHGVATSSSPTGPFVAKDKFIFDVKMQDGSFASAEDPYVWFSKEYGQFFAIVKDFTGRLSGGNPKDLAILNSKNGIDWELGKHPQFMKPEVTLGNGAVQKLNRFERPQLLLSEGGIPLYLYCASSVSDVNGKKDGSSFNIHIPLEQKR